MIIEIKNLYGLVLYSSEARTLKECIELAVKDSKDLRGADLTGADLTGADLTGAYLRGADLTGAYLTGETKIDKQPLQISTPVYFISIFDAHMQIGCEFHSLVDWWEFDDARIVKMDGKKALEFWRKWKAPLQVICSAEERI